MADTPSFWDTLKAGAVNSVTNIVKPFGGALGKTIQNVETYAAGKVGQAGQTVVQATSQGNPTTTPAVKTTPNIPDAQAQAKVTTNATLLGLAVALALIWFLMRRKS